MAPTAADVPTKYDCLINGQGYVYYDPWTVGSSSNAPEKAVYTYTPAFIDRQNVQGDYGDNQQDFWLTYSQKDWSLGEQQRFQGRDEEGTRKYWVGSNVDVTTPGRVSMRGAVNSATAAAAASALERSATTALHFTTSTTLYSLSYDGTITSIGAHGLGTTPLKEAFVGDASGLYMSSTVAGTVGVRKWSTGGGFATFSATASDALAILNNSLYGYSSGVLRQYSTAGVASTLFTFQAVDGTASGSPRKLIPFGGKLLLVGGPTSPPNLAGLWIFDGVGVSAIGNLPANFFFADAVVANGVAFIPGAFYKKDASGNSVYRYAVYYYSNGNIGLLWVSDSTYTTATLPIQDYLPSITTFDRGVIWNDDSTGSFLYYNTGTGGVHTIGSYTVAGSQPNLASCESFFGFTRNQTTIYLAPNNTATATSASVTSPLIDFDNHLDKLFRGVTVEFDSATDGDGGSVDISYRVGDVDGSYTSLQTDVTSGTEYALSGISGKSISIRVTLNKGTSTSGPVLKRLYLRAVPVTPAFRLEKYVLDNTGRAENGINDPKYVELRDGTTHNLDGLQMATNLRSAYTVGTTISVTDKFGTFTGIIDQLKQTEIRTNEFVSEITVREV